MIKNNVVYGGPVLKVDAHLSFGQYIIDRLQDNSQEEDAVALINGETGHKTTFKEILQETVNAASGMKKIGVKRGDVIAFCGENINEFFIGILSTICCGATVTTLNVMYSEDEINHVLNISKPSMIFGSEIAFKRNLGVFKSLPFIKNFVQLNGSPVERGIQTFSSLLLPTDPNMYEPALEARGDDTAFILYSSGTTGLPKGVMLTHLNALYTSEVFEHGELNVVDKSCYTLLTIVPWYHAYGLMSTINNVLLKNTSVYLSGFNPLQYLKCIQDYKVNVLLVVPPIVVFLAKAPIVGKFDLSSVNKIWCGAAPLNSETINETLKRLPNCEGIFQGYGMTETSVAATKDINKDGVVRKPGSGGYVLPGLRAKVVNIETRERLGPYCEGEICFKGPVIMKGYANNKKATAEITDDEGYLNTGDIGYYDDDGCFFVVDRLKELIKYKGHQVAPAIIERVLLQHSDVLECGVVGAPDELAGELPTAFVVPKPDVTLTERELLDFTNERLSSTSRLHGGIIFVKEIPKNASGKILRRVLKQRIAEMKKSKL
uniref:Luciferin 4-monooxygenase n=2 Tax=Bombyx mori TaxID=7091 RepID=A0A8R2R4D2_BOMMO|nr:4-coumarate--CoA ligase 1-like isoform X1 [Bombyx mori]